MEIIEHFFESISRRNPNENEIRTCRDQLEVDLNKMNVAPGCSVTGI